MGIFGANYGANYDTTVAPVDNPSPFIEYTSAIFNTIDHTDTIPTSITFTSKIFNMIDSTSRLG